MPPVKFSRVISFSSEDPKYPASNLLNVEKAKGWKCKDAGEKSAAVILQLEKSCVIESIDIGNENSAFVEIFVSKSVNPDDFKVLRVTSLLMSVQDVKCDKNRNVVRFFKSEEFTQPIATQSWDRIKVVCTQNFNKMTQYGLSFLKVHSKSENPSETKNNSVLGKFALKADSEDESISVGSLFAKRNDQTPVTAASAIKAAANNPNSFGTLSTATKRLSDILKKDSKKARTNDDNLENLNSVNSRKAIKGPLLYADEQSDEEKQSNTEDKKKSPPKPAKKESKTPTRKKVEPSPKNTTTIQKAKEISEGASASRKRTNSDDQSVVKKRKNDNKPKRKPFDKLLEGVVFAISGYQNPYRNELRSKALKMGAKYKADWDKSCTHLICAFVNTPKYSQVLGKGWIVRKDWIEDCHSIRKRLLSSGYKLDKNDPYSNSNDEEIWEEVQIDNDEDSNSPESAEEMSEINAQESSVAVPCVSKKKTSNELSVYDVDTDVDSDHNDDSKDSKKESFTLKILPDFFDKQTFYLGVDLLSSTAKLLARYITAYKGMTSDDVDSVAYIISEDERYKENVNGIPVVLPDWIWECNDRKKLIPISDYLT